MKCHVSGSNVKVLGRSIHALARVGDELVLESFPDHMTFRTFSSAETAYAVIKFHKTFFLYFNYNYYSTFDNGGLECRISMKSALNAFKSPAHMDKEVENLEIKFDPEFHNLIFQSKCKHGIVKTHYVSILNNKTLNYITTKDSVPNRITSSQKIFLEALSNFQNTDYDVAIEATKDSIILKNYIDNNIDLTRIIRTQITLNCYEFDSYNIDEETTISFTLKEFRAVLAFVEALNLPLHINFETTGKPITFIVNNGTAFEAHFVLATTKPDNSTITQNTTQTERKRKETTIYNSPRKKQHVENGLAHVQDDSEFFNFIEKPPNTIVNNNNEMQKEKVSNEMDDTQCDVENDEMDCDNIPPSPTSRNRIKLVFKKCFELTLDPRCTQRTILADNSDSD